MFLPSSPHVWRQPPSGARALRELCTEVDILVFTLALVGKEDDISMYIKEAPCARAVLRISEEEARASASGRH